MQPSQTYTNEKKNSVKLGKTYCNPVKPIEIEKKNSVKPGTTNCAPVKPVTADETRSKETKKTQKLGTIS